MAANYKTSAVFTASAIGATVGVLAALVLAPRSGKETRSKLKSLAQKVQEKSDSIPSTQDEKEELDEVVSSALHEEQEQMRLRRENKRQMPILTNWEREL